jgi:hypothetical protein
MPIPNNQGGKGSLQASLPRFGADSIIQRKSDQFGQRANETR